MAAEARVAIVSKSLARRYWPGEDPIGKRFDGGGASRYREVIGVAEDVRNVYLWTRDEPYLYLPLSPAESADMQFFVRTEGNAAGPMGAVPGSVRAIDSRVQVSIRRLEDNLALWIWPSQMGALLWGSLGFLALLLASVGIYAVMAYAVTQRTREIGIRMALGSPNKDVLGLLLREGMRLVGIGVAIGLLASIGGSRVLSKFLYGLSAVDGLAFAGVSGLLAAIALLACWIPARRLAGNLSAVDFAHEPAAELVRVHRHLLVRCVSASMQCRLFRISSSEEAPPSDVSRTWRRTPINSSSLQIMRVPVSSIAKNAKNTINHIKQLIACLHPS
jgi:hypothetical protein